MTTFEFVPRISTLTAAEIDYLRRQAIPGSHLDSILRESCLGLYHVGKQLAGAIRQVCSTGDVILSSFLPDIQSASLLQGPLVLVRSEFLILRQIGSGALHPSKPLIDRVVDYILASEPRAVIYRLCDYSTADYSFFPATTPPSAVRGCRFLLECPELFDFDTAVIEELLRRDTAVSALIPFIQLTADFVELAALLQTRVGILPLGAMLETPANLFTVSALSAADFYVFGPSDLLRYFYGDLSRSDPRFAEADIHTLTAPLRTALYEMNHLGGKKVYFAKSLVGLTADLALSQYPALTCHNLWMPSQLAEQREIVDGH